MTLWKRCQVGFSSLFFKYFCKKFGWVAFSSKCMGLFKRDLSVWMSKFDVLKGLFCWNQIARIYSSLHLLVCLVLNFSKGALFESLESVRSHSYCLINLKRKTCFIDCLFSFFIKVCEGLLFALKKEFFLLRLVHIFVWGWIIGPLIGLINF